MFGEETSRDGSQDGFRVEEGLTNRYVTHSTSRTRAIGASKCRATPSVLSLSDDGNIVVMYCQPLCHILHAHARTSTHCTRVHARTHKQMRISIAMEQPLLVFSHREICFSSTEKWFASARKHARTHQMESECWANVSNEDRIPRI